MTPARPAGYTHIVGADQAGVRPLHVRIDRENGTTTSAWLPTPEEIEALRKGAVVEVLVVGGQPPMLVKVAGPY